jgi:hypothetical protein
MKLCKFTGIVALVALMAVPSTFSNTASQMEMASETLREWVETERRIARERAAWESQRLSVEHLIEVQKQELEALQERIAASEEDIGAAERERGELTDRDQFLRTSDAAVAERIAGAEQALQRLRLRLPPPLQEEARSLYNALPEPGQTSTRAIAQRIQPVMGILTLIQRFNQVVTIVDEFREFEAGNPVQTQTIYFGLAGAYFVDAAGRHAGHGRPGANGWEWTEQPEMASSIQSFITIHRGTEQARYINLPVEIR